MKCKKCPGWEECPARNGEECVYADFKDLKKDLEMEHALRIRLENINYELVREKQENDKKLKALEIIKEKRVDITFFDTYVKWNWEKYLNRKLKCSEKELTKDEFNLLKEVLL